MGYGQCAWAQSAVSSSGYDFPGNPASGDQVTIGGEQSYTNAAGDTLTTIYQPPDTTLIPVTISGSNASFVNDGTVLADGDRGIDLATGASNITVTNNGSIQSTSPAAGGGGASGLVEFGNQGSNLTLDNNAGAVISSAACAINQCGDAQTVAIEGGVSQVTINNAGTIESAGSYANLSDNDNSAFEGAPVSVTEGANNVTINNLAGGVIKNTGSGTDVNPAAIVIRESVDHGQNDSDPVGVLQIVSNVTINNDGLIQAGGAATGFAAITVSADSDVSSFAPPSIAGIVINNNADGTIDGNGGVAIDNSINTAAMSIVNQGTILGGVKLGSGADALSNEGGTIDGSIIGQGATGSSVNFSGDSTISGAIDGVGKVTVAGGSVTFGDVTDNAELSNVNTLEVDAGATLTMAGSRISDTANFTIDNSGTITDTPSSSNTVLYFGDVSNVTINNDAGGVIQSVANGIDPAGFSGDDRAIDFTGVSGGTINNAGTITANSNSDAGPTVSIGADAHLDSNGQEITGSAISDTGLVNQAGGVISNTGASSAIGVEGTILNPAASISIDNTGTISTQGGATAAILIDGKVHMPGSDAPDQIEPAAVDLTLTNEAGGVIEAASGLAIDNSDNTMATTFVNAGTIDGSIKFGSGADVLTNNGGTIDGAIIGQGVTGSTVTLNGNGVIEGAITDVDAVTVAGGMTTFDSSSGDAISNVNTFEINPQAVAVLNSGISASAVSNDGTLSVSSAQTIAGNYTQSGTLDVTISPQTVSTLTVNGTATIEHGASIDAVFVGGLTPSLGATYTVLTADTLTATPSDISVSTNLPSLAFIAAEDGNSLEITTAINPAGPVAQSIDAPTGNALNTLIQSGGGGSDALVQSIKTAFLTSMNGTAVSRVAKQLAPASAGTSGSASAGVSASTQISTVLSGRTQLAMAGDDQSSERGLNAGSAIGKITVFAQPFGGGTTQDASGGIDGYTADTYGVLFGFDGQVADGVRAGAAFSYSSSTVNGNGDLSSDETDVDSYMGSLFGSYTKRNWFVDGSFTGGHNDYKGKRVIDLASLGAGLSSEEARGNYGGTQYGFRVSTGLVEQAGKFRITPSVFAQYTHLDLDGYTESGAGALSLATQGTSYNSTNLGTVVSLSYPMLTRYGEQLPEFRIGYYRELGNNRVNSTAQFVGGGGAFTTPGLASSRDNLLLGLGYTIDLRRNVQLSLSYDFIGNGSAKTNEGSARVRWQF